MARGQDSSKHPNRQVHRGRWEDPDPTPPHGTPRPNTDFISEDSTDADETLDPWAQEDIDEERAMREERNNRGYL